MRFKSKKVGGFQVFAVSGVNTVSFAVDFDAADTAGLLGFAVEREDHKEDERYFMYGMKVFQSVVPNPGPTDKISTYEQPVQSFIWDDFTAKDGREYTYWFHPLKGTPKNLDRSAPPIEIKVKTEQLFSRGTHDIFFNRGVASSQAYRREFGNQKPDKIADPVLRERAYKWLTRDLRGAMLKFVDDAKSGDTLLGCFYEFRYLPVAEALKAAIDRGVEVRLILDAKDNAFTDKHGKFHEAFPWEANKASVAAAKLPKTAIACWRSANPGKIPHNKFMVLLKGAAKTPSEVWTGSTNLSDGGLYGQTNVGHWVRDQAVAGAFRDYWELLSRDPGARKGDDRQAASAAMASLRKQVADLLPTPTDWTTVAQGTTSVFSPRAGLKVLDMYVDMADQSAKLGCVTLAFGVNKGFKAKLANNLSDPDRLTFLLLEKEDKPKANASTPYVPLTARQNVYSAWGSYIKDPIYQWAKETNAKKLQLNQHVSYIHSKFLLKDPLGDDPIVVTGSANFSDASTQGNDENMIIVRGDKRVADIYLTEFNRLFFHYYFRSINEKMAARVAATGSVATGLGGGHQGKTLFLDEDDCGVKAYKHGSHQAKAGCGCW